MLWYLPQEVDVRGFEFQTLYTAIVDRLGRGGIGKPACWIGIDVQKLIKFNRCKKDRSTAT
jgi:hypothetical protein